MKAVHLPLQLLSCQRSWVASPWGAVASCVLVGGIHRDHNYSRSHCCSCCCSRCCSHSHRLRCCRRCTGHSPPTESNNPPDLQDCRSNRTVSDCSCCGNSGPAPLGSWVSSGCIPTEETKIYKLREWGLFTEHLYLWVNETNDHLLSFKL